MRGAGRRLLVLGLAAVALAACGSSGTATSVTASGTSVPLRHARTFSITQNDGYRVVQLRASITTWGGAAEGPEQQATVVLVPRDREPPPLTGELAGATLVRTPVERIAVNYAPVEAMAKALGVSDRLVAVGGRQSYDDAVRDRVLRREIAQVGYGWHMPPELDALLGSRPDVFLMAMAELSHAEQLQRANELGVPTLPVFADAELDYMGKVDYMILFGMLVGRESQAEAYVAEVEQRVAALKELAARQPRRRVLSAWYGGSDVWMVTLRNAEAALIRDANAEVVMQKPDDPRRDSSERIGTEVLLRDAIDADCWVSRDTLSEPYRDAAVLRHFKAYREGCMFAADGRSRRDIDSYDIYETAPIRPDLLLGDYIRMLHPALRTEPFVYVQPDVMVPK
ncbi:MAG: ABC transporter substrate-binding protein [Steroidobacteraceae bacterium]